MRILRGITSAAALLLLMGIAAPSYSQSHNDEQRQRQDRRDQ